MSAVVSDDLSEGLVREICRVQEMTPTNESMIIIFPSAGAVSAVKDDATAVSNRGAKFWIFLVGCWGKGVTDEVALADQKLRTTAWVKNAFRTLSPLALMPGYGTLPADHNFDATGEDRHKRAVDVHDSRWSIYGSNIQRLSKLKHIYDPHNVFNLNINILPFA